ncbi:hypothetical protein B0A89_04135 [Paracoccus contaminans]|uniref:Uncharacterized protein n=1 Tax=Paracoccus contaminans TaxID=1945662 RepID=A0A1W6CVQ7_9RHOB|nr:hypothetical protein B0A89_04135 [Paracoccus contaminans]
MPEPGPACADLAPFCHPSEAAAHLTAPGGPPRGRLPAARAAGPRRGHLRLFAARWSQRRGGTARRGDPAGHALPPAPIVPHIRCAPRMRARKGLSMSRHAMQRLSFFLLMGVTLYASLGLG